MKLNKSQEQLDNEKKWDGMLLGFLLGLLAGLIIK